jgi:teichoic acid transport system ATP-binding protein
MAMPSGSDQVVVELANVTKIYTVHHEKPTLAEQLFSRESKEKFKALDDVSLKIFKGEKIGIIGRNGSGKTTILKIIAQITTPTSGAVRTEGKVVSLIDLTAGFHPDLSGYENIFLNGLLIGMSSDEINKQLQNIIDFADIGNFIYSPIYTYSEGMRLRLGFSVAVYSDPDILILDEGIAAGDIDFQEKSGRKIEE